jgi:hypothetical protein
VTRPFSWLSRRFSVSDGVARIAFSCFPRLAEEVPSEAAFSM